MNNAREQLDRLFAFDATASVIFGVLSLLAPHGVLKSLNGGLYDHNVHEVFRLYGCLRLACGWILWHVRAVDDGKFRRSVCEALCFCYMLQALAVSRAQFTDQRIHGVWFNWIAIVVLLTLAAAYASFRFRKGGSLIKIFELPTSSVLH